MKYYKARLQDVDLISFPGNVAPWGQVRYLVPWMRPSSNIFPAAGSGASVDTPTRQLRIQRTVYANDRFEAMRKLYKEYSITGVRIEYWPPYNPGAGGVYPTNAVYQSQLQDIDTGAVKSFNDFLGQAGCRSFQPGRPFKQYISFRKLARQQHADW